MGDEPEDPWDETVEESFPASDPPAWGGSIGGPQNREDAARGLAAPAEKKVAVQKDASREPDGELRADRRR